MAGAAAAVEGRLDAQTAFTDFDILNFALNLEYLEAEFYTVATTGQTISQIGMTVTGSGASGATTGGSQVALTGTALAIAQEIAKDEQTHVKFIQTAIASLGGTSIAKPAINLGALGIGFSSLASFLTLARAFEDIGVTAYGGAAPLISSKVVLGYAARILAVEALHSGNIRLQIAQNNIQTTALDGPHPAAIRFGVLSHGQQRAYGSAYAAAGPVSRLWRSEPDLGRILPVRCERPVQHLRGHCRHQRQQRREQHRSRCDYRQPEPRHP